MRTKLLPMFALAVLLIGVGAAVPRSAQVEVINLCPGSGSLCLGSNSGQALELWTDGVRKLRLQGSTLSLLNSLTFSPAQLTNGVGYQRIMFKNASESVADTTLQADDDFVFAIGASEVYNVVYYMSGDGTTTGDFKANLTVPASATYKISMTCLKLGATTAEDSVRSTITSSSGADVRCGTIGNGTGVPLLAYATVKNSTTAGNVTLMWAEDASDATGSRVYSNSSAIATRIQ